MARKLLLFILFTLNLFSNPTSLDVVKGSAYLSSSGKGVLHIHASDGAILHWKDFSINPGELTRFIQPSEMAWVLNRVTGKLPSEILGELHANGQIALLNPDGILFGNGAVVDVGGIIASTLNEGIIVNKGVIRARNGDVILMGREVTSSGKIETVGMRLAAAEDNPYELAINFVRPKDEIEIKEINGRIILTSDEKTLVSEGGELFAKGIALLSNGVTAFQGYADVNDGYIEISGKKGFHHTGKIDRNGGHLIFDPEADVTISTVAPYNYSFEKGQPTADLSNIFIGNLIEEIEKGPVTITTSYQGEGGATGSIHIKDDVAHTYTSSYPLIFNCSGTGGIKVDGSLTNHGSGTVSLNSKEITISGQLDAKKIAVNGLLNCSGGLYGHTLNIQSEGGGVVSGTVAADGGPLTWIGGGNLTLSGGEMGSTGASFMTLQGLENIFLEKEARLFTLFSKLSVTDLSGVLAVEDSSLFSSGPLNISGKEGALYLSGAMVQSNSSLDITLGRFFHGHNSSISSQQPITLSLGSDLILSGNSLLTSLKGIFTNAKGNLILSDQALIKGPALSLISGESIFLKDRSKTDGEGGALSITSGGNLFLDGSETSMTAGQIAIHTGEKVSLENHGQIASHQGTVTLFAGKGLHLFGNGSITATGGDLELFVSQGNLTLFGNSTLSSTTHGSNIFIGKSLIMENFSHILSVGEKGTTIVVDQLGVGGGIVMGVNSMITTGSSPLRIFTASRDFNSIHGTFNGRHYIEEMPLYLTTSQDQWGMTYPDPFFAHPFTVFHKENGLIQTSIGPIRQKTFIRQIVNFIGPFTAELFRDLHPYDEYTSESINFTDNENPYFIRRRSAK